MILPRAQPWQLFWVFPIFSWQIFYSFPEGLHFFFLQTFLLILHRLLQQETRTVCQSYLFPQKINHRECWQRLPQSILGLTFDALLVLRGILHKRKAVWCKNVDWHQNSLSGMLSHGGLLFVGVSKTIFFLPSDFLNSYNNSFKFRCM